MTKNEFSEFILLGETEIDCGDLCDALEENIEKQNGLTRTFAHNDDKTIKKK